MPRPPLYELVLQGDPIAALAALAGVPISKMQGLCDGEWAEGHREACQARLIELAKSCVRSAQGARRASEPESWMQGLVQAVDKLVADTTCRTKTAAFLYLGRQNNKEPKTVANAYYLLRKHETASSVNATAWCVNSTAMQG